VDIEVGFDWSFVGIAWELELEEVVDRDCCCMTLTDVDVV